MCVEKKDMQVSVDRQVKIKFTNDKDSGKFLLVIEGNEKKRS